MYAFKLDYVDPGQAQGLVKENYSVFPEGVEPPLPFVLMSASPGIQAQGAIRLKYYMSHPNLSPQLMASVRYLCAKVFDYPACIEFNGGLLGRMGATDADLKALVEDLDKAPLEENEITMLKLVDKFVRAPETVTAGDVQACRDAGWTDADVMDVCFQAATMQATGRLMKAFQA